MTGDGSRSPWISGVPSLLGLDGRLEVGGDTGEGSAKCASSGTGCVRAFVCTVGVDLSTGGLCGTGGSCFLTSTLPVSATTVDADEEDVDDSRTVDNPCVARMLGSSGARCLLTGGRLSKGLTCLTLYADFEMAVAGEYDVIDVAFEAILNAPGDSA